MSSVLIVDDERPVTEAFANFFERHGNHSVSCAYTGAEAIAAYEASRPDLVLLDLRLPDMTGFDVYARIREHLGKISIPKPRLLSITYEIP